MQRQGLDAAILRKIGIPVGETPAMQSWHDFLDKQRRATRELHVALVGKYDLQDAYKSIRESLNLAGIYDDVKVKIDFVNSEGLTRENVAERLAGKAGLVICPGFGQRGIEGKIVAAEYARTHDVPCFGICLGMQMMVIEFARDVLGLADADSSEMNPDTPHNVIDIMEEQKNITQMGGTMRLGIPARSVPTAARGKPTDRRTPSGSATATATSSTTATARTTRRPACSAWA